MSKKIDFLSKFKKLSSMNEAVVTKVNDSDDTLPHQYLGLSEEDANKDQTVASGDTSGQVTPASGQTPVASGSTSGATPTAAPQDGSISPEAEFDQTQGVDSTAMPDQNTLGGDPLSITKETKEDIQNELLKLQVSAMRKMSDKISELEGALGNINMTMVDLKGEVNKVKDPAPMEKLENRWKDSYPFKYTLGDIWDGNVFQGRKDLFDDSSEAKGDSVIKQAPDGTYEAPYDEMPKMNDFELRKSFEVY